MENKISNSITLRKLTLKSLIGFGVNSDLCVGEMINQRKYKELISIYYNLSKIDFNDEIKQILCINKEREIFKPGVNKDYYVKNIYAMVCEINSKDETFDLLKTRNVLMALKASKKRDLVHYESTIEHKNMNRRINNRRPFLKKG